MSLFGKLFHRGGGAGLEELVGRLGISETELRAVSPQYQEFSIPKKSGGMRQISAPAPELKALQRRVLRCLLDKLKVHPAVTGFERGHSIVSNAAFHARKAVVVSMDIRDFFTSTRQKRVIKYFQAIGWNREVARLLTLICTHNGALPQGAPTSPRLSNAINYRMDARLAGLAAKYGAAYTRYADDLTFSFDEDVPASVRAVTWSASAILKEDGYEINKRKKVRVRRQHQRQTVTGLVVNERTALPRKTRRWLRAVEHRIDTGQEATLTAEQLAGWQALRHMVELQREQLEQS